jgi:ribose transport system substrate-binding protein
VRRVALTTCLAAILALVTPGSLLAKQTSKTYTIDYAVMAMEHPLFGIGMVKGAQIAARQAGVNLRVVDAHWDSNKQLAQIEDMVAQKPDAILVNAVTAKEQVPAMEKARAAHIPVIAIDTRPVGFTPDSYVAMDMFPGGFMIGQRVARDLHCTGNYATIWAVGNEQGAERIRGLKAGLADECSKEGLPNNLHDVGDFSGAGLPLRDKARQVTNTLLAKYPAGQLQMIFGQTDEWGVGAYLATQAAHREDVKIYAMDDNPSIRQMIAQDKNLIATTHHDALEVGAAAVQAAVNKIQGRAVAPEILFSFSLVDQANVKYDTGWAPNKPMAPSYSNLFFPQQLVIPLPNHPYSTPAAATNPLGSFGGEQGAEGAGPATQSGTSSGTSALAVTMTVVAAVLAIALAATLFWVRRGRAAASREGARPSIR